MKKRVLSLVLVLTMLFTMLPATVLADMSWGDYLAVKNNSGAPTNPFHDVGAGAWYHDSVMYVYVNKLFNGVSDTVFDPNGTMTRGMFVTVLGRLAGVDAEKYQGQSDFADVSPSAYYAPYVAWAAKYGITTGTGGGNFSPNALINRQQMASFFVRYFDALGVTYSTDHVMTTEEPVDFDQVADWAKDDVKQMWQTGVLVGDGVSFDPYANATRAQAATICDRLDEAVDTWYKELGEKSDRVRLDPKTGKPYGDGISFSSVYFYDGDRLIDVLTTVTGFPLSAVPAVEKSSKEGAVLLGYYYDQEFTEPFYAENNVLWDTTVYAKYREMDSIETLTVRTFTQMDASPNLQFAIQKTDGTSGSADAAKLAVTLESKDGSDPVEPAVTANGNGTYTIYAPNGFNEGCAYELTLADGWMFVGKEATIRTASFTIKKEKEEKNMRMGDEIIYIQDTSAISYKVAGSSYEMLTSDVLAMLPVDETTNTVGTGTFSYSGGEIQAGDILCIYEGTHPLERKSDASVLDPATYVKVMDVSGNSITFSALDETARQDMYEIPDNFPIRVAALPTTSTGEVGINGLDIPMYESMLGISIGTLDYAKERLSKGDFITLYVSDVLDNLEDQTGLEVGELYFARVDDYRVDGSDIIIEYTQVERQDIIDSMNLYTEIKLTATDLMDTNTMRLTEMQMQAQIEESGFVQEAAYLLSEIVTNSEEFRSDTYLRNWLLTDENGNPLPEDQIELLGQGGFSIQDIDLDVGIGTGSKFDGVEISINIDADLAVDVADGSIEISLTASFVEEVMIDPGVKGELVYKDILGIPIPIGVYIAAHVDMMNYTAFSFAAEMTSKGRGNEILSTTSISSDLERFMDVADKTGLSDTYFASLDELMQKYSDMLRQETDWVQLLEEKIFAVEICYFGLVLGVEADFVVRADMSIAIGSSLEYEVGKRYSFWFKIGLFEPTAGSDTMDLIDEQFKFQFYVLGKLGVKVGVKAKVYAGIGTGDLASVGIAAELGPYVKLYGLFIYDYMRTRPANSDQWQTSSSMIGGLNVEFGLYLIFNFEAEALGLFEYSHDFLNEEYPLLEAGDTRYYYNLFYKAQSGQERVFVWDEDRDSRNGITMDFPDQLRSLAYVDLKSGVYGVEVRDYKDFSVSLSSPYFTLDQATGRITVDVPEHTHYLECDITVTYLHGKMPFSRYDMTATIPVAWTDLGVSELQEYYTISVMVGQEGHYENGRFVEGYYEELWTKRVLKGQQFNLPNDAEIRELADWSDLKFSNSGSGYRTSQTTNLTAATDMVYYYDVVRQEYSITVDGVQNKDGSTGSRTFKAYYGETFDFSDLETTGTEKVGEKYTRFADVTTTAEIPTRVKYTNNGGSGRSFAGMENEVIDLTQPITGAMAEALKQGVTATANYVDDTVTAVFTFNGLTHDKIPEIIVKLRSGSTPNMDQVEQTLLENILMYGENNNWLGISEVEPKPGPIFDSTNYLVTCVGLSGERALIKFDGCPNFDTYYFYSVPEAIDKMVDSLIVNIDDAVRRGYTFQGWYTGYSKLTDNTERTVTDGVVEGVTEGGDHQTENIWYDEIREASGLKSDTQTLPEAGITFYAKWKPNTYLVDFSLQNVESKAEVAPMVVTYDTMYSESYTYDSSKDKDNGQNVAYEYGKGEAYGSLPVLPYTTSKGFLGWSTTPTRRFKGAAEYDEQNPLVTGHRKVTDILDPTHDALANVFEENHTLYAQWKNRYNVNNDHTQSNPVFRVSTDSVKKLTYDGNGHTVNIVVDPNRTFLYETYDGETERLFADFLTQYLGEMEIKYKNQGYLSDWVSEAKNAGVYDIRIRWEGNNDFLPINCEIKGGLVIEKRPSEMRDTPDSYCISESYYGNLVLNRNRISDYTGDGTVQFAVTSSPSDRPSESSWRSDVIFNGDTTSSFYLWTRLSEGNNYLASNAVCSTTEISRPGETPLPLIADSYDGTNVYYALEVKTSDSDWSGTDSEVYATIGSGYAIELDSDANDHEKGDCRKYMVTMGSSLSDETTTVPLVISLVKDSTYPGWKLGYLKLYAYSNADFSGDPLFTSNQLDVEDWFLAKENPRDNESFTLSLPSWNPVLGAVDLPGPVDVTNGGRRSFTIGYEADDSNHKIYDYNAYKRNNAPEFKVTFKSGKSTTSGKIFDQCFDKYLTWSAGTYGWDCDIDCTGIRDMMVELDMYSVTMSCTVPGQGTKTVTFSRPYTEAD